MPSLELLAHTTPLYCLLAVIGALVFEARQLHEAGAPRLTLSAYIFMTATCVLSPVLGYADCETVGQFGAVGYALLTRFHGVLVFGIGVLGFKQEYTWVQVASYSVLILLLVLAAHWKAQDRKKAKEAAAASSADATVLGSSSESQEESEDESQTEGNSITDSRR